MYQFQQDASCANFIRNQSWVRLSTVFLKFKCGILVVCVRSAIDSHKKSLYLKYKYIFLHYYFIGYGVLLRKRKHAFTFYTRAR